MLILLHSGLLLPCDVVPLLTLLALLVLLPSGLLLCSVIRLLTLLPLLILLPFGLLLPCSIILLLTLLPLLILLPSGLLLLCSIILLLTLLALVTLLLLFRLGWLLLSCGLSLFILFIRFVLPRVSRNRDPEHQKKRGRLDDSNWFHVIPPLNFFLSPSRVI